MGKSLAHLHVSIFSADGQVLTYFAQMISFSLTWDGPLQTAHTLIERGLNLMSIKMCGIFMWKQLLLTINTLIIPFSKSSFNL